MSHPSTLVGVRHVSFTVDARSRCPFQRLIQEPVPRGSGPLEQVGGPERASGTGKGRRALERVPGTGRAGADGAERARPPPPAKKPLSFKGNGRWNEPGGGAWGAERAPGTGRGVERAMERAPGMGRERRNGHLERSGGENLRWNGLGGGASGAHVTKERAPGTGNHRKICKIARMTHLNLIPHIRRLGFLLFDQRRRHTSHSSSPSSSHSIIHRYVTLRYVIRGYFIHR